MSEDQIKPYAVPRWAKRLAITLVIAIAGAGGGAGVTNAVQHRDAVTNPGLETLIDQLAETRLRVNDLTARMGSLEASYAAQGNTLAAAVETMRDLVQEVRENGKSISRLAGIVEQQKTAQ